MVTLCSNTVEIGVVLKPCMNLQNFNICMICLYSKEMKEWEIQISVL